MSDEEKREYEELKSLLYTGTISQYGKRKLIDLIKKQSKEIEELKEENEKYKNPPFFDEENYISKEESEQKERKAYIKGTNDADELCNKKWENKIKAKIEEYRRLLYSYEKDLEEKLHYVDKGSMNCIIAQLQILQSLLEKE